MKRNKGMQLSAVLAVMLLVCMVFVPAVSAAPAIEKVTQTSYDSSTCPTCGIGDISDIYKLDRVELADHLHIVLNSAEVKKLTKELESTGYELHLENARGLSVTTATDGNPAEGVVLPFSGQDDTEVGILAEVNKHKVIKAVAVLTHKNESGFPISVEQLSVSHGKIISEKVDVASILNSDVSIQYNACDACKDLYGVCCAVGCGLDVALLCILAGVTTIVGGLACTVVAAVVCYFIGVYGCAPEAAEFCDWIGYC